MDHGITIVVAPSEEPKEDAGVAPGMQMYKLDPPQQIQLRPVQDVSRAPVEGQSTRFVVEGRFVKVSPEELVFEIESVCSQDWNPEQAFAELAENPEDY